MKSVKQLFLYSSFLLLFLSITGCSGTTNDKMQKEEATPVTVTETAQADQLANSNPKIPAPLPVQFQTPIYKVDQQSIEETFDDSETGIKVGATIRSTHGPQPLWDILKRLAALKDMNVSWASDVDREVLVDVDISAEDDFYEAIDNMLRQVDYFHEVQNNTLVIKYKETRQFHIAMPFVKSSYRTSTGGNMLGNNEDAENIDGTIEIKSEDNSFDIWANIQTNMDAIFDTWSTETIDGTIAPRQTTNAGDPASITAGEEVAETITPTATRRFSSGGNMYIIDKPIGLITVSAPRPILDELDKYFSSLKKELYKQIAIDAKIVEVKLTEGSSLGIDWSGILKGQSLKGNATFGNNGTILGNNDPNSLGNVTWLPGGSKFLDTIALQSLDFDLLFGALNEQGDAKVLSNPKISVMNGQPALITVGENITYISSVESDIDSESGIITYTTEMDSLLSGLGLGITATILENNQIVMNLVPVTSELTTETIPYENVGTGTSTISGARVGVPIIAVREMSTTVRIGNGETLIIGGLISESNDNDSNSVPVLGDIPLIGGLFSYEEKTKNKKELVIIIKPRIL